MLFAALYWRYLAIFRLSSSILSAIGIDDQNREKKREKRILSFWLKKIVFDLVINHYLARLFFDYFNTFCFTSDDVDLKLYVCCTLFVVIVFIAALWSALCCMQCHHYELKVYNNMLLNKWRLCWNHGCHLSVTPSCI